MFYQSHCFNASANHLRMAELQRKAGREDLARESEKTALARRISGNNWIERDSVAGNLEFGEQMIKTNLV